MAASLLLGGALAANASGDIQSPIVDSTQTGTIHITKYKKTDAGVPATGVNLGSNAPGNDPLGGVEFSLVRITGTTSDPSLYSLTTDASWQAVQAVASTFDPATFSLSGYAVGSEGTVISDPTDGTTGVVDIADLPLGLYYVTEVPSTANAGMVEGETRVPIVPFLVTLPMTVTTPDIVQMGCYDGATFVAWETADGGFDDNTNSGVTDEASCNTYLTNTLSTGGSWRIYTTVPGTNATSWSYELWLYPKNDVIQVTKTITPGTDGALTAGTPIEYNLTVDLPAVDPNVPPTESTQGVTHHVSKVEFTDILDPRLDYTTNSAVVTVSDGTTTLTSPTDFGAVLSDATDGHGGKLVVTLTSDGMDKLTAIAQAPGYTSGSVKVTMTFQAKANTESAPGDPITNGGQQDDQDPDNNTGVDIEVDNVPSDKIIPPEIGDETQYGGLSLWKYGVDKTAESQTTVLGDAGLKDSSALAGAQFMVFASQAQAIAYAADSTATLPPACVISGAADPTITTQALCENADDNSANAVHGIWVTAPVPFFAIQGPINTPGDYTGQTPVTTVTSGNTGEAVIGGLRYGTYWVLETQAPAGYSLLAQPFEITIEQNLDDSPVPPSGVTTSDDLAVPNVPANAGFPIPLTGGSGVLVFTLLALGIAVVTIVVLRKQKHAVA